MSGARTAGMATATAIGFLIGAYLGLYVVLATVDWAQPFESQMVISTVGVGTLGAIGGALLTAPDRRRLGGRIAIATLAVGLLGVGVLLLVEADPALLILVGLLEVAAVVTAVRWAGG